MQDRAQAIDALSDPCHCAVLSRRDRTWDSKSKSWRNSSPRRGWEDVPEPVQRHAKLVLLDTLGVILAGLGAARGARSCASASLPRRAPAPRCWRTAGRRTIRAPRRS